MSHATQKSYYARRTGFSDAEGWVDGQAEDGTRKARYNEDKRIIGFSSSPSSSSFGLSRSLSEISPFALHTDEYLVVGQSQNQTKNQSDDLTRCSLPLPCAYHTPHIFRQKEDRGRQTPLPRPPSRSACFRFRFAEKKIVINNHFRRVEERICGIVIFIWHGSLPRMSE